ncbi:sodium:solute symporter [Candidatus Hydrogenedentota bacterium]
MPETIFTPTQGYVLLAIYGTAAFLLTWLFSRRKGMTKTDFLLAGRSLGLWRSAFSIAATWIWAPALFIASREAYTRGIAGLFWFTVPNVLCLVLFAFFADRIRSKLPDGFTLSGYIRRRFSRRVQVLYWIELLGLAACSFAVQLLAGGKVISTLTAIPFFQVTVALAVITVAYSAFSGLKASVITDYAQMGLMLVVGIVLIPWALAKAGGFSALTSGLGGISGEFNSLWNSKGLETAWVFGIPVTIGLMAGPFGDQSFWQRAFAAKRHFVKKAFIYGALIFVTVPLMMSVLGFIAAGAKWNVDNAELVGLEVVQRLLPAWAVVPFTYMLISGLVSTLDSNLCAVASLTGHDFLPQHEKTSDSEQARIVAMSRLSMVLLAAAALAIANLPGIKILYLFLFYGTLRASTFLPTVVSLSTDKVRERSMFWGILAAFATGLPIFAFGKFTGRPNLAVVGALCTVLSSGGIVLLDLRKGAERLKRGE